MSVLLMRTQTHVNLNLSSTSELLWVYLEMLRMIFEETVGIDEFEEKQESQKKCLKSKGFMTKKNIFISDPFCQ